MAILLRYTGRLPSKGINMSGKDSIFGLKLLCGATIAVGLIGLVLSAIFGQTLTFMGTTFPASFVAFVLIGLGVSKWRKIPQLEKELAEQSRLN
jgi:hypothetical protein